MLNFKARTILVLIVSFMLVVSVLSGCGQKQAGQDGATTAAVTTAAAETTAAETTVPEKKPADFSGTVSVWGWDENSLKTLAGEFNKAYVNVKIDYLQVGGGDYQTKVQTTAAAGMDLADILWQGMDSRGILYTLDIWEDLTQAPYNFDKSSIMDYAVPLVSNAKGQVVGIPWDFSIGGLCYNKVAAKEFLGTDDPKAIQDMFPTWDAIIEKGKEVAAKKGFMFANIADVQHLTAGLYPDPVIDGTTADLSSYKTQIELLAKIRDAGIVDKIDEWTPGWGETFIKNKHVFYPMPMWGPTYILASYDKDASDKYGLITPPGGGFVWGGTAWGISNTSKNKELAWEFTKWSLLSDEGSKINKEKVGYFPHLKKAYDDPEFTKYTNKFFGNQDIGDVFFKQIAPITKTRPISKYDQLLQESLNIVMKALQMDSKFTAETAFAKFTEELKAKAPELQIK